MCGIYVHIPFCQKKCNYCAFVSKPAIAAEIQRYFDFLEREISASPHKGMAADTIYFGGGTPSYADAEYIARTIDVIKRTFSVSSDVSITIEGNPDSLTGQKLKTYKEIGINRLSIGLQSANDELLKKAGRIHTKNDFQRAVNDAVSLGFSDISADVILGLPGDSVKGVLETLKYLVSLGVITHISAYGLKAEEGTPWRHLNIDEDLSADMYDAAVEYLEGMGYHRYEVSNFAKRGFESKHNLKYWTLKNYIGFGVAAHSLVDNIRCQNPDDFEEYYLGKKAAITLTEEDKEKEFIMLSLRLAEGLSLSRYKELFNKDFLEKYRHTINRLRAQGLLIHEGDFLKIASSKFGVMNSIIVEFF